MGRQPIRVLLIEDDEDDYVLTRDLISDIPANPFHLDWAKDYKAGLAAIARQEHDVYLLDYRLNGRSGLDLLREAKEQGCRGPIIILTGQGERAVDLQAMTAGAADYLIKGQIDASLLERSIRYAVERERDREALRQANDNLERRVQERTLALQQANHALQDADRRKDEFLAMLAHELRNPLGAIRNAIYFLSAPKGGAKDTGAVVELMERQVLHLTRMVDDLLEVSRITRGEIQLRRKVINLASAVAHAVETVQPLMDAQRHKLVVALPLQAVYVEADPTRVEQVLCNLLNNAAKFTEYGGRIEVTVERDGAEVALQVRDDGMGISAELLPIIFDLFTQADRSLARAQGGLGIGLTLVRKLVEMMGGRITAHSDGPGRGSQFLVRLPAITGPLENEGESKGLLKEAGGGPRPLRVLVVEDSKDAAGLLVMLLKLWGYDVRDVHDGPAALVTARTYHPEVVLLDIGLPGLNGYDVARQLRRESDPNRPLIVAMTGYGNAEDRRRSQEAGFDHHLLKPVDPGELERLLADRNDEHPAVRS
jgi:two-component system CheB/CheR fusion protein